MRKRSSNPKFRRPAGRPDREPAPFSKPGFRVYFEWIDATDNVLVRMCHATDRWGKPESVAREGTRWMASRPGFRIAHVEEVVVRYGWIGIPGIDWAAKAFPPPREGWEGCFDLPYPPCPFGGGSIKVSDEGW